MVAKFLVLSKQWSYKSRAANGRKDEKIDVEDFPVHGCTQELNSSPHFSSLS